MGALLAVTGCKAGANTAIADAEQQVVQLRKERSAIARSQSAPQNRMYLILCGMGQSTRPEPGSANAVQRTHDLPDFRMSFYVEEDSVLNPPKSYVEVSRLSDGLYMPVTNAMIPRIPTGERFEILRFISHPEQDGPMFSFAILRSGEDGALTMTTNRFGSKRLIESEGAEVLTARCVF